MNPFKRWNVKHLPVREILVLQTLCLFHRALMSNGRHVRWLCLCIQIVSNEYVAYDSKIWFHVSWIILLFIYLFIENNEQICQHNWSRTDLLIVFFGYIWTIYCLLNAKFRTKEHNYTQTQIMWPKYSGSRHLNRDNKTANINVKKTVVYLQLITAKWHIENNKNNERWYYFRSTMTPAKCF